MRAALRLHALRSPPSVLWSRGARDGAARPFVQAMRFAALLSLTTAMLFEGGVTLAAEKSVDAQPPPPDVVSLFEEATAELKAGSYASACPKLERVVERIPAGIGAKLALGDCYLGAGRLASAQRAYVGAEAAAAAAGNSTRQGEARLKAEAVTPKLGRLLVELAPEARAHDGFTVTRDGVPLSAAEFGIAVALDAGEHVVVASATGRLPRELRIAVIDGANAKVRIDALEPLPATEAAVSEARPPSALPREEGLGTQEVTGIVLGVAGLAGLVTSGVFTGLASSALDDSNGLGCTEGANTCTTAVGFERREQALSLAHVATGTLVGGAALLAAGAVVFFTAPSEDLAVSIGPAGLRLGGRF